MRIDRSRRERRIGRPGGTRVPRVVGRIVGRSVGRIVGRSVAPLVAVAATAWLAACTVGPEPRRPDVDVPTQWAASRDPRIATDAASRLVAAPRDDGRWWTVFHDPVLDGLIESARGQNLDVEAAGLRIAQARAQRDVTAAGAYPMLQSTGVGARLRSGAGGIGQALSGGASGGGAGGGGSSSGEQRGSPITANIFQVGFDATWEPDLFGGVRRGVQAADADIRSAEAQRRDAMVSLAAEIARAYLSLRGAERQRAIATADIESQQCLQALVDSRNRAGLAPTSDLAAQDVQVAAARARLPQIERSLTADRNRLALLLALPPGALDDRLGAGTLPPLPPEVPVGLPGELLRRRPDVGRREADLEAATARVGVATAALFPSIRLGAVGSLSSNRSADLFDWSSRFGLIGAQLTVPIFEGGRLRAQVRIADLRAQEAVLTYRQTVLGAFHEVDNAMTTYAQEQRRAVHLAEQSAGSRRARDLARDRYQSGLGAFIDVLNAEHQVAQTESDLAESAVAASTDLVALFKALGGGWEGVDAER